MSYGMMIAVQMNEKDIFDRLWRWSKKYMQHQSGSREGYFAWSCRTDGTRNSDGAASDGELYFITSLLFASNRWGNDTGINYKAEAQRILNCTMPKEYEPEQRPGGFGGFGGGFGGGQQQGGKQRMYLIDPETKLITFTPDGFGQRYTDPSYHIPAFYEVWARWADDGRSDYWRECAAKSREFLHKAINEETGLNPDMCQYINSRLSPQELATEFNRRVYKLISEKIMSGSEVTLTSISQYFSEEELSYITAYVSTARSETFHREALDKCIRTLRNEHERLLTKNPNEMTEDEYRAYMNSIGKNKK